MLDQKGLTDLRDKWTQRGKLDRLEEEVLTDLRSIDRLEEEGLTGKTMDEQTTFEHEIKKIALYTLNDTGLPPIEYKLKRVLTIEFTL